MHINFNALDKGIHGFDTAKTNHEIKDKNQKFKNSTGETFTGINKCLDDYDKFCVALNDFFTSTSGYLNTSYDNLKKCEASNTLMGGSK